MSRSASGQIMLADFPPSYRVIGFRFSLWAVLMIIYPTSVEPVNDTLSMPLCWETNAPVSPKPVTMLITPGGKPAWLMRSPSISAVKGVCQAGLMTIVHPAAKAGAIFQVNMSKGQFQGIIWPTTPIGSLMVIPTKGQDICKVFPLILSAQPAKCLMMEITQGKSSTLQAVMVLPLLRDSKYESHQTLASMRSASLLNSLPLCAASVLRQVVLKAFLADCTAKSTSYWEAATACPITSSVAGLMTSKGLPPLDSTSCPLIKSLPATALSFSEYWDMENILIIQPTKIT